MSNQSEMSKRQARREQIKRKEARGKWIGIGLVAFGAIFLAFLIIYPYLQDALAPAPVVATAAPQPYPQADGTALGDPNAPIRIDAYEDFQCPACLKYTEETEPQIIKNLVETGQVYYVFHNYPFIDGAGAGQGGESDQAANAVMCANDQGKFWEMHGTIFANWNGESQGAFADRNLIAFAEKTGLEMTAFNACFKANKFKSDIQADFDGGNKLGVQGTPSVFVNGVMVAPGYIPSYDDILKAIESSGPK